jgi:hypothetical protein
VHYYRFDQSGQAGLQCIVIKALNFRLMAAMDCQLRIEKNQDRQS